MPSEVVRAIQTTLEDGAGVVPAQVFMIGP